MTNNALQTEYIKFLRAALTGTLPVEEGTPVSEEELAKMSIQQLAILYYRLALSGQLPQRN